MALVSVRGDPDLQGDWPWHVVAPGSGESLRFTESSSPDLELLKGQTQTPPGPPAAKNGAQHSLRFRAGDRIPILIAWTPGLRAQPWLPEPFPDLGLWSQGRPGSAQVRGDRRRREGGREVNQEREGGPWVSESGPIHYWTLSRNVWVSME